VEVEVNVSDKVRWVCSQIGCEFEARETLDLEYFLRGICILFRSEGGCEADRSSFLVYTFLEKPIWESFLVRLGEHVFFNIIILDVAESRSYRYGVDSVDGSTKYKS
jgi:hypothetical protein